MDREKENVEKGGFASAYLNRWQLQALEDAAHEAGLTRFYYVQRLILSHLIEKEKLPAVDLERAIDKWERRKDKPHGNTKEVRARAVRAKQEAELVPERTRKLTPAQRREARKRRATIAT
jgi:hypothetical protein